MSRKGFWITCLLAGMLVSLQACGNRETGAELLLQQAGLAERAGETQRAENLYRQVVSDFPRTAAVARAHAGLIRLRQPRVAARNPADAFFESLTMVLEGYRSLYGVYPRSADEIDASGYLFDSDYMAEQVPGSSEAYLVLGDQEGSPYRIWLLSKEGGEGVALAGPGGKPRPSAREELQSLLGGALIEAGRVGALVFLAPPAVAGR